MQAKDRCYCGLRAYKSALRWNIFRPDKTYCESRGVLTDEFTSFTRVILKNNKKKKLYGTRRNPKISLHFNVD